jgi:hypothetical protein
MTKARCGQLAVLTHGIHGRRDGAVSGIFGYEAAENTEGKGWSLALRGVRGGQRCLLEFFCGGGSP